MGRLQGVVSALALAVVGVVALTWRTGAPAEFSDRADFAACPARTQGQVAELTAEDTACFDEALVKNGKQVEFQVTSPTTEGDPIRSYYRTSPDVPGFVVYTDSTDDTFGSDGWSKRVCPDARSYADPGDCTYTEFP